MVKGLTKMQEVTSFIDKCLIQEYAFKDQDGYYLDIDNVPDHDLHNFLELLMQNDTNVRDLVRYEMQKMIDTRLPQIQL